MQAISGGIEMEHWRESGLYMSTGFRKNFKTMAFLNCDIQKRRSRGLRSKMYPEKLEKVLPANIQY